MEKIGHYYTVYYVALLAGFDKHRASKLAFHVQLPDQIDIFDATDYSVFSAGISALKSSITGGTIPDTKTYNQIWWSFIIQAGLHSLTGESSKFEQTSTSDLVLKCVEQGEDILYLSFLIHRYGDTFAHVQQGPNMGSDAPCYRFPFSHAVANLKDNSPDQIHTRYNLYRNYAVKLYKLMFEIKDIESRKNIRHQNQSSSNRFNELQRFLDDLGKNIIVWRFNLKNDFRKLKSIGIDIDSFVEKGLIQLEKNYFVEHIMKEIRGEIAYDPFDDKMLSFNEFKRKYDSFMDSIEIDDYFETTMKVYANVIDIGIKKRKIKPLLTNALFIKLKPTYSFVQFLYSNNPNLKGNVFNKRNYFIHSFEVKDKKKFNVNDCIKDFAKIKPYI